MLYSSLFRDIRRLTTFLPARMYLQAVYRSSHTEAIPKLRQKFNLLRAPFFPFSVSSALSLSINYLSGSTQAVMGLRKFLCLLTSFLHLSFVRPSPVQGMQSIDVNDTLPGFSPLKE